MKLALFGSPGMSPVLDLLAVAARLNSDTVYWRDPAAHCVDHAEGFGTVVALLEPEDQARAIVTSYPETILVTSPHDFSAVDVVYPGWVPPSAEAVVEAAAAEEATAAAALADTAAADLERRARAADAVVAAARREAADRDLE